MSTGAVEEGKRVTWAELFFDLVFVVAVTELSALIERDHSWSGLLRAVVVFVPIYWTWVGTAVQTNLQDAGRPLLRLRIFTIALAAVFMALALGDAYGRTGMLFALAYWGGRIVLGAQLFARLRAGQRVTLNPWSVSIGLTGPVLVAGALCHGDVRELVWAAGALIDLSTPLVARRNLIGLQLDAGHLAERFGLFVLIALGESVVSVGTSIPVRELTVAGGVAVTAAFALSAALWWVYFHFAADAMRHAMATARVQLDITRNVLSYGHLGFIAAIVVVAVGMHDSVAHPGHALSWAVTGLLFGGTAAYLALFAFTRWAMFRLVSWTRLTTAIVVVAALPLGRVLPAVASLALLAVVVAALNVVELLRVEGKLGRRRAGTTR